MTSITSDDYFKDISSQITEEDRAKAGYRVPKMSTKQNIPIGLPKAVDVNALRGNLDGVALPVPVNFHEGGMFTDVDERRSYEKFGKMPSKGSSMTDLDLTLSVPCSQKNPSKSSEDEKRDNLEEKTKFPITTMSSDRQLIGKTSNNPFANDVLVGDQSSTIKTNIGENEMIVARGPNNIYGRAGFYGGIFKGDRFGYLGATTQVPKYDALNVDDVDKNGKLIDYVKQYRSQETPLLDEKNTEDKNLLEYTEILKDKKQLEEKLSENSKILENIVISEEKETQIITILTRLETKVDDLNKKVDDFAKKMDNLSKDANKTIFSYIGSWIASIF